MYASRLTILSVLGHILKFCLHTKKPIQDDQETLQEFCETIELILRKGLEGQLKLNKSSSLLVSLVSNTIYLKL